MVRHNNGKGIRFLTIYLLSSVKHDVVVGSLFFPFIIKKKIEKNIYIEKNMKK